MMAVYACITARLAAPQLLDAVLPSTLVRILELLALCGMLWFTYRIYACKANAKYRGWQLVMILVLAACNFFIVVRGHYGGGIKSLLLDKFNLHGVPAYILPFVILSLPNKQYIKSILKVLFWSSLISVPIWLLNQTDLVLEHYSAEAVGAYLPVYCIILILFRKKLPLRRRVIVFALFGFYFLLMLLNARRNMVVSLSLMFVTAFIMGNATAFRKSVKARIALLSGAGAIVLLVVTNWASLSSSVFQSILNRGLEDTRSQVELLFLMDMAGSPVTDWVVGRGMDGTYMQMTQNEDTYEVSMDRDVIETGYLLMILKGGILYVVAVLSFLFTAMIRALRSGKALLVGMGLLLAIYILDLYMTTPVSHFAVKTVIFWLMVSVSCQYDRPSENENSSHISQ